MRAGPVQRAEQMQSCADLIRMGARPVIAMHLSGVTDREAIQAYVEINGKRPPRGLLPSSRDWFFMSRERVLNASAFLLIYDRIKRERSELAEGQVIQDAFRMFRELGGTSEFDISRAYLLTRLVRSRQVELHSCGACGTRTLALAETPKSVRACLSCTPH